MSAPVRSFLLRTPEDAAGLTGFLKSTAPVAAKDGRPLFVTVAQRADSRSARANRFMWGAVIQQCADQLKLNGQTFSPETIHEYFKRAHLPEITASGKRKWDVMPSGERRLAIGTSDLDSTEFAEYLEKCQAEAASEWGVEFDSHRELEEATA